MFKRTKEFDKWAKDLSRAELLKDVVFPGNVAVIEVYKEASTEENKEVDLIVGQAQDGSYERKSEHLSTFILPVAKVLKVGNNLNPDFSSLKVGSIITIPDSVKNTADNPDFINLLQLQRGNQEPIIPKGMKKKIAIFNRDWDRMRFQIDKLGDLKPVDAVTFLIHLNTQTVQSIINEN